MATDDTAPLNAAQKRKLAGPALSTPFDMYDRLFPDFRNGDVFDYAWDERDLETMLGRSGKARSLEQVLTLPLRSAPWRIQGEGEALKLVQDNLGDKLGLIIDQATGATIFRRAFFELVWKLDNGRVVYDEVAWRPPQACQAGFNPKTGKPSGFRQLVGLPGGIINLLAEGKDTLPGYVRIPAQRAFIYTYGTHRDPIHGVSDMDVAYWMWETQQKILFLWFQFLEKQALPNTIVFGNDPDEADRNAASVAEMNAGGVIGLERPADPTLKTFEILESSGKGADQFMQAVEWLGSEMIASVLAGFTELAYAATQRRGSYGLSQDQSKFFLASRQAVADEMAEAISRDLFGPLVRYNLGADAPVPKLQIGPLEDEDTQRALEMLKAIIAAPNLNVPHEFVDELLLSTATYLGLNPDKLHTAVQEFAQQRAADQQAQRAAAEQAAKQAPQRPPPGAGVLPERPTKVEPANTERLPKNQAELPQKPEQVLANTVDAVFELVNRAQAGEDPEAVLAEMRGAR